MCDLCNTRALKSIQRKILQQQQHQETPKDPSKQLLNEPQKKTKQFDSEINYTQSGQKKRIKSCITALKRQLNELNTLLIIYIVYNNYKIKQPLLTFTNPNQMRAVNVNK